MPFERPLHVLVLPSWTADAEKPYHGVFFREQAQALRDAGLRVGFACVEQRSLRQFGIGKLRESHFQISSRDEQGLRVVRMHGWNTLCQTRAGALLWTRLMHRAIAHYIRQEGLPDLMHAHSALWAGYAAATFSRAHNLPYVLTEHSTAFPRRRIEPGCVRFLRRAFDGAAAVVAVGRNLRWALAPFVPSRRIAVIPNLLDASFFSVPVRRRTRGAGAPFTFLGIGNLIPTKGFDVLLRAFAAAFRNCAQVRLQIGGDGPERGRLAALTAQLGISGQVEFRGPLSRCEVRDAMLAADAFVLASSVETFGVVVAEAMALGLPVIATRSGGPEDFVTPECGYLVDSGDPEELARSMAAIRLDFRYAPESIRARVEAYASPAAVTAALDRLYRQVLCHEN
jgi:glycosyltransferase involved in cell wall biosynthesis